jgi:hypothetical protein
MNSKMVLLAITIGCTGCMHYDDERSMSLVRQADESGICYLHRTRMNQQDVPIYYGFMIEPEGMGASRLARTYLFPYSAQPLTGGCEISSDSPETARAWVCARCVKNKLDWMDDHPRDPWVTGQLANKPTQAPEPNRQLD